MDVKTVKSAAELIAEARRKIDLIEPDQLFRELDHNDVLIVDVREEEERLESGVIPGSIHAPRGLIEFYADPTSAFHKIEFEPDRRIVLHCGGGGRGAMATATLKNMGYEHVSSLDGGFRAWKAAGLPVISI